MNKSEILEFINANPECCLATTQDGVPHVRWILLYRADENGIIFQTGKMKDLYKQLSANPNVEIVFFNKEEFKQVFVNGTVELIEDLSLKEEILEARPTHRELYGKDNCAPMAVYILRNGTAWYWTRPRNVVPKEYVQL
jgi:uncharacterized pyridoxamine 5'-phosphate oxidase family protein